MFLFFTQGQLIQEANSYDNRGHLIKEVNSNVIRGHLIQKECFGTIYHLLNTYKINRHYQNNNAVWVKVHSQNLKELCNKI